MPNPEIDTTPGDVTAPDPPINMVASVYGRGIQMTCIAAEPADFLHYEFWKKIGVGGAYNLLGKGRNSSAVDMNTTYGVLYFYKARLSDTTGNLSAFSVEASATPALINTPDVQTGAISTVASIMGTGGAFSTSAALSDIAGETVSITVSSASSPILITWNASVILANFDVTSPDGYQGITVTLRLTRGLGAGTAYYEAQIKHLVPNSVHIVLGTTIWVPVSMAFVDVGLSGTTTYHMRWAVEGSYIQNVRVRLDWGSVLQVLELKR